QYWPCRRPASTAWLIRPAARSARDVFPARSSLGRVYVRLPTVVIAGRLIRSLIPLLATFGVAGEVSLPGPRDSERPRLDVVGDHRPGAGVCLIPHRYRCHQHRVHPDECRGPDLRAVLAAAVVVGGDRACADVGALTDVGV